MQPVNCFSGNVTLSAPDGPIVLLFGNDSSNPYTTGLSSSKDVYVSASAKNTVTPGHHSVPVTVYATANSSLSHLSSVDVVVGGFTLTPNPASRKVKAGNSANAVTITVDPQYGFMGSVAFDLLPADKANGYTLTSTPVSVNNASASVPVTINVPLNAATGQHQITLIGTCGFVSATCNISLIVTTPDFDIEPSRTDITMKKDSSTNDLIKVVRVDDFTDPVSLSLTLPTKDNEPMLACKWYVKNNDGIYELKDSPIIVNLDPSTEELVITAISTATAGTYQLVVTGTSGTIQRQATINVTITDAGPDFDLEGNPTDFTGAPGGSAYTEIDVTPIDGFTGDVNFTVTKATDDDGNNVDALKNAITLDPNPVTIADQYDQATGVSVDLSNIAVGTYHLEVTGASGSISHIQKLTLNVTNDATFDLWAEPSSLQDAPGDQDITDIVIESINGFNGAISLSVENLPPGVSVAFEQPSLSVNSDDFADTYLALQIGSDAKPGIYKLRIFGKSGSITRYVDITLTIIEGDSPQRIAKLQYSTDQTTWTDVPQPGDPTYPLTVNQGDIVAFKAIKQYPELPWPSNKPIWSGEASGIGETKLVQFETSSSSQSDLKSVSATCSNTVTANVLVNPTYYVSIISDAQSILSGGPDWPGASCNLTITATDYQGQPIPNLSVDLSAVYIDDITTTAGSFDHSTVITDENGVTSAIYYSGNRLTEVILTANASPTGGGINGADPLIIQLDPPDWNLTIGDWQTSDGVVQSSVPVTANLAYNGVNLQSRPVHIYVSRVYSHDADGNEQEVENPQDYASIDTPFGSTDADGNYTANLIWSPPSTASGEYTIEVTVGDVVTYP